ncbi:hypothetical protein A176_002855 [Myxococcus hansupus]|uniref:Uncharacterized protein n=1 Tax=Pseudomyxococcus hansupus TaxID=1297742 RepID=A0A0H4WWF2_9BACT|nr:hypothetical protein [Myxococcus hansupus]AKQ65943.1 hypothetical protein A176_002855 [Myxococcus hansupus]
MTVATLAKGQTPGIAEVLDGLKTVADCIRDIHKEKTEQVRIQMAAHVDVERIHANRDVLLHYLDRSFDERKENFRQLFERLDTAIATNNPQLTGALLESVLKLADSSPFKALADVASTREVLSEKGKEWQF